MESQLSDDCSGNGAKLYPRNTDQGLAILGELLRLP